MSQDPRQNRYQGINAHLHSFLQHESGGWKVFHSTHISNLAVVLDFLPKYEASPTQSLQIAEFHPDTGLRHFSNRVDYTQPPIHSERYNDVDQQRIAARMQAIAAETA